MGPASGTASYRLDARPDHSPKQMLVGADAARRGRQVGHAQQNHELRRESSASGGMHAMRVDP